MLSVPITTKIESSKQVHGMMYSIQHYVIKVVIDLRQVNGFLWVLRFPPPIKRTAMIKSKKFTKIFPKSSCLRDENSIVGMDPMATHCRKLIITGIYQVKSYMSYLQQCTKIVKKLYKNSKAFHTSRIQSLGGI